MQRRNSIQTDAMASLSMAADPGNAYNDDPTWPTGWRPWTALLGCFFLMFNSWGWVNAYGTYASYYTPHLLPGTPITLLSLVGASSSSLVLLLSIVAGRLLDAGYRLRLLVTGTILTSLGTFLLSVVNGQGDYGEGNYGLIWLTQGFITGVGMACFFVSSSQSTPSIGHTHKKNANKCIQLPPLGSRSERDSPLAWSPRAQALRVWCIQS